MANDDSEGRKKIFDSFLDFNFKAAREAREASVKAKHEEFEKVLSAGPRVESTLKCMRTFCPEMRWAVPDHESVLCEAHTKEVVRGAAKAPPLRWGFDYTSVGRKTFLVEPLPGEPKEK